MFYITYLVYIVIFLSTWIIFSWWRRHKKFPPGPFTIPFLGNIFQLGMEPHKAFMRMKEIYGDIFAVDFGCVRSVVITDHELIKEAFNLPVFSGRPDMRHFAEPFSGTQRGLILTEGKEWSEQRRFVLRSLRDLGFAKKSMESLIHEEVEELIENLKRDSKSGTCAVKTENRFNVAVLNALWKITTGERYSHDDPKLKKMIHALTLNMTSKETFGFLLAFPLLSKLFPKWSGFEGYVNNIIPCHEMIIESIESHRKTYQPGNNRDLIDCYLEESHKTEDNNSSFYGKSGDLNMQMGLYDLFIAGTETTSLTLTWTTLIMAHNPLIQEKLHEEITKVIGQQRLPSLTNKSLMPYTEAVIMEVLRFSALLPLGAFHKTTEDVYFHGYFLPKNTMVVGLLYSALHDVKIWGDPEIFRPERFLDDEGTGVIKPEAFMPFSTGRRICLGESLARNELFLFVTSIFQRFKVGFDPDSPAIPNYDVYPGAPMSAPKSHQLLFQDRLD